jgi:hypothetical protein
VIPSGQPTALANAIDEALSDPQRAVEHARRASAVIDEQYTIGPHMERLEAIYRDILNRAIPVENLSGSTNH